MVGEYTMSPALYARFQQEIEEAQLEMASDILVIERAVKTEFEIQCILEADRIAKRGIEAPESVARPGVLEADIAGKIERVCRRAGSQDFPHHTMVSLGRDKIEQR